MAPMSGMEDRALAPLWSRVGAFLFRHAEDFYNFQGLRAYNDQFDLGQRTLLDLLDAQNEYFDAQRAAMTARTNLMGAQARTLANMGLLTSAMSMEVSPSQACMMCG